MFDLLLTGGKVVDGTGNPWVKANVAVKDGRIAAVGTLAEAQAKEVLDVKGQVVCPGFVDGHSHSDLSLIAEPNASQKIMQGYTTEVVGLDGMSVAPISNGNKAGWQKFLAGLAGSPKIDWNWNSFGEYLDCIDAAKPATNACSYVGLGTIRLDVMGMTDRAATTSEIDAMCKLAARSMEEGARGVSAGLIYPPSQYQTLDEMVEIAKVAASYDGIFDVHMRSESDRIAESLEEIIEISRRSGIAALITHFKVRGRRNWGKSAGLLERLAQARAEGIDITPSQYPYTAGSTYLHATVPPWYHTNGPEGLIKALKEERSAVKRDIVERRDWENFSDHLGWENVHISSVISEANKYCEGKSIQEIAALRKVDPVDAMADLLVEEDLAVGMIVFGLDEGDVAAIMKNPSTSIITDGIISGGRPHPRSYATSARVLGRYVREMGTIGLEDAVRKLTSLPAAKVRLRRKGLLVAGMDADIVVFDPQTVAETNSYEDPMKHPTGITHVFVHGQSVVRNARHTGVCPGRTIR